MIECAGSDSGRFADPSGSWQIVTAENNPGVPDENMAVRSAEGKRAGEPNGWRRCFWDRIKGVLLFQPDGKKIVKVHCFVFHDETSCIKNSCRGQSLFYR